VSAREELFAFPGAAEGGKMPLLAAESGPPELTIVVSPALGVPEPALSWQEAKINKKAISRKLNNFFIQNNTCYLNKNARCSGEWHENLSYTS
jgi:hypothetical protein